MTGKMGKTKYKVNSKLHNAHELVAMYRREVKQCRKYKCLYVSLRGSIGTQPVRIFLIKYGKNEHWNILLSSDMGMKFINAFELYQIRWNIEAKQGVQKLSSAWRLSRPELQRADCRLQLVLYHLHCFSVG